MQSLKDPVQGRLRRQPRLQPVDVECGHHDVARLTIGEIEDVVQQLLLRARDHPGALRLVDERAQFRCRADALARHYVPDLERRAKEDARGSLQDPHRRPRGHGDHLHRTRDQRGERFRTVERQRLRHQLAEHDRQVGDERESDHEGQPARQAIVQDVAHPCLWEGPRSVLRLERHVDLHEDRPCPLTRRVAARPHTARVHRGCPRRPDRRCSRPRRRRHPRGRLRRHRGRPAAHRPRPARADDVRHRRTATLNNPKRRQGGSATAPAGRRPPLSRTMRASSALANAFRSRLVLVQRDRLSCAAPGCPFAHRSRCARLRMVFLGPIWRAAVFAGETRQRARPSRNRAHEPRQAQVLADR
jgi:hypothetical protein